MQSATQRLQLTEFTHDEQARIILGLLLKNWIIKQEDGYAILYTAKGERVGPMTVPVMKILIDQGIIELQEMH